MALNLIYWESVPLSDDQTAYFKAKKFSNGVISKITVGDTTLSDSSLLGTTITLASGDNVAITALDGDNGKIITISSTASGEGTTSEATTETAGLMSASDKTKLDGIELNANNYVHPDYWTEKWKDISSVTSNEDYKATYNDNSFATNTGIYTPTITAFTTDQKGHVRMARKITKDDITNLGIPAQDTTYSEATTTTAGLMSAEDKEKLDGLSNNEAAVDDTLSSTSTNPVQNKTVYLALQEKQNELTADTDYLTPETASTTYQPIGSYVKTVNDNTPDDSGSVTLDVYDIEGSLENDKWSTAWLLLNNALSYTDEFRKAFYPSNLLSEDLIEAKSTKYITSIGVNLGDNLFGKMIVPAVNSDGLIWRARLVTKDDLTLLLTEATESEAGLMSAADKAKLDAVSTDSSGNTTVLYSVATTNSNGLMSSSDKTKLDGIADNANNYVHPSYDSHSSDLYKITIDSTGHVSAASSVTKSDITNLGIPSQDTVSTATTTGTGNAITSVSATDGAFTFTKGSSFSLSNHTHDNVNLPNYLNGTDNSAIRALFNNNRANRLAFLPAKQIIIEKTTDSGSTWASYGASDGQKLALFSETRSAVTIPLNSSGNIDTACGLRITFTAMDYNVPDGTAETSKYNYWNSTYVNKAERYCQLFGFYFWLSSVNNAISIKIEAATGANSTKWTTLFDSAAKSWSGLTGWSGNDWVYIGNNIFGGSTSQTSQYWNYRMTFFTSPATYGGSLTAGNLTQAQNIAEIRGYGNTWWNKTNNNYMANDHLYSWDYNKNATFPANVVGSNIISKGSATQPIYFDASGVAKNTTYSLQKSVPSNAVFTDTTYTLTQDTADGHKITLTPSTGSATTITIPDNNTTYSKLSEFTNDTNYITNDDTYGIFEEYTNKVSTIDSSSDDDHYPSARAVYTFLNSNTTSSSSSNHITQIWSGSSAFASTFTFENSISDYDYLIFEFDGNYPGNKIQIPVGAATFAFQMLSNANTARVFKFYGTCSFTSVSATFAYTIRYYKTSATGGSAATSTTAANDNPNVVAVYGVLL